MNKPICSLLLAVLAPVILRSQSLVVYPAPAGSLRNDDFTVKVRRPGREWQDLSVYLVKVDKVVTYGPAGAGAGNVSVGG